MDWELVKTHWLRVLAVLLALVVVGLGAAVYAAERDTRPRAQVGDVYDELYPQEKIAHTGTAYLPWTQLEVGFDDPTDELPEPNGDASANVRAPEDGSFVRVRLETGATKPMMSTRSAEAPDVDVVLRADGKDYSLNERLDSPSGLGWPTEGDRWVAVDGEPADLEVRITVDGLTQVVDENGSDQGRARGLADVPTGAELFKSESVDCGKFRIHSADGLEPQYPQYWECKVAPVMRTPYIAGVGWADEGHEFYVVTVEPPARARLTPRSADPLTDRETRMTWSATLGGDPTIEAADSATFQPSNFIGGRQFIFSIPEGEQVGDLVISGDARVTLRDPFTRHPARRATIEWTVPGRKLP